MTFSAKNLKLMKILSSAVQKTFHSLERKVFHVLSLLLQKLHLATFFSLREKFLSIRGLATSSFALNTELVFLEAIKK